MARILIIDDSPTQLTSIKRIVEKLSHQAITATDGAAGVEAAKSVRPDLILMDVVMPHINGFQATRMLKRGADTQDIPIILVTTKDQETDRMWGLRQGAKAYLTKPFSEAELASAITDIFKNSPLTSEPKPALVTAPEHDPAPAPVQNPLPTPVQDLAAAPVLATTDTPPATPADAIPVAAAHTSTPDPIYLSETPAEQATLAPSTEDSVVSPAQMEAVTEAAITDCEPPASTESAVLTSDAPDAFVNAAPAQTAVADTAPTDTTTAEVIPTTVKSAETHRVDSIVPPATPEEKASDLHKKSSSLFSKPSWLKRFW